MKRDNTIDRVRVTANFLVVLIHAYAAFQYCTRETIEFNFWMFVCNGIGSVAMPALFLISGYLLLSGMSGNAINVALPTFRAKIWRRVKRLLIPYVVWNLTYIAFYLIAAQFVPRLNARVVAFAINTWQGAFAKTLSFMAAPIDTPLWYLRTIFVYSLAAPILLWTLRFCKGFFAYMFVIAYFIATTMLGLGERMEFTYPAYSLLLFVIGAHLAIKVSARPSSQHGKMSHLHRRRIPAFPNSLLVDTLTKQWLWPIAIGGTVGLGILFMDHWWDYSIWRDICFICATPMLFLITAPFHGFWQNASTGKIFSFLQQGSFFLYGGHFLFCSILLHTIAPKLSGQFSGKFSILVLVFFVGGTAFSYAIYAFVDRFFRRKTGVWTGTL